MPHIEVDQGVHWNVFSPLWNVDGGGNFIPQLATEVPTIGNGGISEDGLDWRIKLRPNVVWHDGTPFTADDVKYTLELINNPHFRAYSRNGHEQVTDIKVRQPDRDHLADEEKLRAIRVDPVLDLHRAAARPREGR
jgi:peptide/nickel transport system substrate-binding protein